MTEHAEHCPMCMGWHLPPKCAHNPETPCTSCGRKRGYVAHGQRDTAVCAKCWWEANPEPVTLSPELWAVARGAS